jgi:hypothetical protein
VLSFAQLKVQQKKLYTSGMSEASDRDDQSWQDENDRLATEALQAWQSLDESDRNLIISASSRSGPLADAPFTLREYAERYSAYASSAPALSGWRDLDTIKHMLALGEPMSEIRFMISAQRAYSIAQAELVALMGDLHQEVENNPDFIDSEWERLNHNLA